MINPQHLHLSWIDPQARNEIWKIVQECLIELHGLTQFDALQRSHDLRTQIEAPPPGLSSELFYHAEPFQVACDLAGTQLDLAQHRARYNTILSRHNW